MSWFLSLGQPILFQRVRVRRLPARVRRPRFPSGKGEPPVEIPKHPVQPLLRHRLRPWTEHPDLLTRPLGHAAGVPPAGVHSAWLTGGCVAGSSAAPGKPLADLSLRAGHPVAVRRRVRRCRRRPRRRTGLAQFFDNSAWNSVSVVAPTTYEIFTEADLENLPQYSGGVITFTSSVSLTIQAFITTSIRFDISGGNLKFNGPDINATLEYSGTGTFFSGTGGIRSTEVSFFSSSTGTFLNLTNPEGNVRLVNIRNCTLIGWDSLGSINDFNALLLRNTSILNTINGFDLVNTGVATLSTAVIGQSAPTNGGALYNIDGIEDVTVNITQMEGSFFPSSSLLRVDPDIGSGSLIVVSNNTFKSDSLFDTAGTAGTFQSVFDATVALTTIDSVTDSGGVARFNFTVGPTLYVHQQVDMINFVTETSYNQTGIITTVGAGFYEISSIAFTADDTTGDFSSDSVQMFETATTLSNGDTIVIDSVGLTDYDGGATVYNVVTNEFSVNKTFNFTTSGTWSTGGLDQTDPRVLASGNPRFVSSEYIGSWNFNGASDTTSISSGTYVDIDMENLSESANSERFKVTETTNGEIEYTGNEPFSGTLLATLHSAATPSEANYRISIAINNATPVFATAAYMPLSLKDVGDSVTVIFPVSVVKGDTIKLQIAGDGTSQNVTIAHGQLSVSM